VFGGYYASSNGNNYENYNDLLRFDLSADGLSGDD
jgi:hypothetical protein